tara:strand:+ start:315 stop:584 length:270 start_codon:yes stop_codon:yes gene_type:complete
MQKNVIDIKTGHLVVHNKVPKEIKDMVGRINELYPDSFSIDKLPNVNTEVVRGRYASCEFFWTSQDIEINFYQDIFNFWQEVGAEMAIR